jgi:hypothetical protein
MASAEAFLFRPQVAYRVRWNLNTDTPLPPEESAGQNPPDGAIIDYFMKSPSAGPITLEILDSQNKVLRRFTNIDPPEPVQEKELDIPTYWIRPFQILSSKAGAHRFVWDLHYPPPESAPRTYPIAAIFRNTPSDPPGPWVMPGQYVAKLTVNSRSYMQPLTVKMDPRVKTPTEDLARQFALSMQCYEGMRQTHEILGLVKKHRVQLKELRERIKDGPLAEAIAAVDDKLAALEGSPVGRRRRNQPSADAAPHLNTVQADMTKLLEILQGADAKPTNQAVAACETAQQTLKGLLDRWHTLQNQDVKSLNDQLRQAKMPILVP